MRRKTIFSKMMIGALLLSILSGCGKKAGVDYIQENDSRQDAVSASDLHLNYSISNGRTTVNVDADVNTSLSTQSAPVATAIWCDYTNEDITRIVVAIFDESRKASPIISHLPTSSSTPSTEVSTMTNWATSISIETNQINRRKIL